MHFILLTTETCIKCKSIKPLLEEYCGDSNIKLDIVDANTTLGSTLISTYSISQAPTLFIYDNSDNMIKMFSGDFHIQTVKNFIEKQVI